MSHDPMYKLYQQIIQRCCQPNNPNYKNYGGRGIQLCERWRTSFLDFLADIGPRPSPKHQIDRINNKGHYEPGNCRWATPKEQSRNRRNNRLLTLNNQTLTIAEWSDIVGIHSRTIRARIDVRGWGVERALTTPARAFTTSTN